ncbi:MAG TPA: toll/interleukin-1 receptor domain-containing protein [Chloroflexia bacterium]
MTSKYRKRSRLTRATPPPAEDAHYASQLVQMAKIAEADQYMSQQAFEALTRILRIQVASSEPKVTFDQTSSATTLEQAEITGSSTLVSVEFRTQVFISYSHRDRIWLERLQIHLKPYRIWHKLDTWVDTSINPGAEWRDEITKALARAKVAVLLVSPDFLASEFIGQYELPKFLESGKRQGLTILWIPIRPSAYKQTPIYDYQALSEPTRPLSRLNAAQRDDELVKIAEAIYQAAK